MTEPIKLPPLPSAFGIVDPVFKRKNPLYDVKDLQDYAMAYARAAVKPYAKRIAELEAQKFSDLPLRYEQALSELIDKIVPGLDSGDILADARQAITEADRQARGEPVARWAVSADGQNRTALPVSFTEDGHKRLNSIRDGAMLYTTPQPQQVPEGYKLVPIEPTPKMKTAGIGVEVYQESKPETGALTWAEAKEIYKAMIEAAPESKEKP